MATCQTNNQMRYMRRTMTDTSCPCHETVPMNGPAQDRHQDQRRALRHCRPCLSGRQLHGRGLPQRAGSHRTHPDRKCPEPWHETAAVIVFVLWGTAEMSDLVRGALIAIPKHQYESSEALGMSRAQTYWYIIIPQTVRRLIPLSISLITRMIKTTSLVLMIGVVEVLKVAQQIIEANRTASPNAAFGIYLTVFILYFLACWPISLLAGYLEKKWK